MFQAAPALAWGHTIQAAGPPFLQTLNPLHSTLGSTLVALIPLALLLVLLAVLRMTAWRVVIIGAAVSPGPGAAPAPAQGPGAREAARGFVPFGILIVVVVAATGPWSHLGKYDFVKPAVEAVSSLSHKTSAIAWEFAPAIAGTWILVSWLIIVAVQRVRGGQIRAAFRRPRASACQPAGSSARRAT